MVPWSLPHPSSLQLGIEISGKTMVARGLMGMRLTRPRVRMTDEGLWKSQPWSQRVLFSPISFPEPAILGKEREALG